jgi:hypothetical protein
MTNNHETIRLAAFGLMNEGYPIEGKQLEDWLNGLSPESIKYLILMPTRAVERFVDDVRRAAYGPSQLEVRKRIDTLIEDLVPTVYPSTKTDSGIELDLEAVRLLREFHINSAYISYVLAKYQDATYNRSRAAEETIKSVNALSRWINENIICRQS